jgi:cell division protein FtsL
MSTAARSIRQNTRGRKLAPVEPRTRRRNRGLIKRTGTRRVAPLAIVAGLAAVAIIGIVLLEQVILAQSAFRLDHVRNEIMSQQALHEELLLETAKLDSSARIEHYARTKLGMTEPVAGEVQYIVADLKVRRKNAPVLARGRSLMEDPAEGIAVSTEGQSP